MIKDLKYISLSIFFPVIKYFISLSLVDKGVMHL